MAKYRRETTREQASERERESGRERERETEAPRSSAQKRILVYVSILSAGRCAIQPHSTDSIIYKRAGPLESIASFVPWLKRLAAAAAAAVVVAQVQVRVPVPTLGLAVQSALRSPLPRPANRQARLGRPALLLLFLRLARPLHDARPRLPAVDAPARSLTHNRHHGPPQD